MSEAAVRIGVAVCDLIAIMHATYGPPDIRLRYISNGGDDNEGGWYVELVGELAGDDTALEDALATAKERWAEWVAAGELP